MTCPYCPFLEKIMLDDDLLDTSMLWYDELFHEIPKFILRHCSQIKLFIEAFEKQDPSLLR